MISTAQLTLRTVIGQIICQSVDPPALVDIRGMAQSEMGKDVCVCVCVCVWSDEGRECSYTNIVHPIIYWKN